MALATSISVLLKADSTQFIEGMNKAKMSAQAIANFSKKVNTSLAGAAGKLSAESSKLTQSMKSIEGGAKTTEAVMNQLSRSFIAQSGGLSKAAVATEKYEKAVQELNSMQKEMQRQFKEGTITDRASVMTNKQKAAAIKKLTKVMEDEKGVTKKLADAEKRKEKIRKDAFAISTKYATAEDKRYSRILKLNAVQRQVTLSDQTRKAAMKDILRLYDEESGKTARLEKRKKKLKDANKQLFSSFKQLNTPLEKHNAQMKKLQILAMAAGKSTNWLKEAQKRLNAEFNKSTGGKYMKTTLRDRIAGGMSRVGMGRMAGRVGGEKFRAGRAAAGGRPGGRGMVGMAMGGMGAFAAYRGIRAGTAAFVDFEKSMARVRALTNATSGEFKDLQNEARSLAMTTVFSADQAAEAMQFFALAGYEVDEIYGALPATLDLAVVGAMDVAEATDIAVKIMAGFGIAAKDFGKTVDVLSVAMTNANTSMVQLGNALKFVGPVASASGYAIEEVTAALMVLANAGLQGEMGGTALRNIMMKLAKPSTEAADQMEKLGISAIGAFGQLKPLGSIIDDLNEKLGHLGSGQKLKILATMFEARALPGVAALMAQGGGKLMEFEDKLKVEGRAEEVKQIQMDTVGARWDVLISNLKELAIAVGTELAPMIKELLIVMAKWIGSMSGMELTGKAAQVVAERDLEVNDQQLAVAKAEKHSAQREFLDGGGKLRSQIRGRIASRSSRFTDSHAEFMDEHKGKWAKAKGDNKARKKLKAELKEYNRKLNEKLQQITTEEIDKAVGTTEWGGVFDMGRESGRGSTVAMEAANKQVQKLEVERSGITADFDQANRNEDARMERTELAKRLRQGTAGETDYEEAQRSRRRKERNVELAVEQQGLMTESAYITSHDPTVQRAQIYSDAIAPIQEQNKAMEDQIAHHKLVAKYMGQGVNIQGKMVKLNREDAEAYARQTQQLEAAKEARIEMVKEAERLKGIEEVMAEAKAVRKRAVAAGATEKEADQAAADYIGTQGARDLVTTRVDRAEAQERQVDITADARKDSEEAFVSGAESRKELDALEEKNQREQAMAKTREDMLENEKQRTEELSYAKLAFIQGLDETEIALRDYRKELREAGFQQHEITKMAATRKKQLEEEDKLKKGQADARKREGLKESVEEKHKDKWIKFQERVQELRDAGLTDELIKKESKDIAKSLGLTEQIDKGRSAGALIYGTAAAYSAGIRNQRGNPQVQLAKRANTILTQILKKPAVQVNQANIGP